MLAGLSPLAAGCPRLLKDGSFLVAGSNSAGESLDSARGYIEHSREALTRAHGLWDTDTE